MLTKRLSALFLLVVCVSCLFAGCTINVNIGNPSNDTANETLSNHNSDTTSNMRIYQSRATIYISNKASVESPDLAISSSDLSASRSLTETYTVLLNTKKIKSKIQEEYPNIEYELTLEPTNETEVFDIIATSENSEKLEDVCNLAASLFCEEFSLIIDGTSCCIVVDYAKSTQLVGTN